MHRCRNHIMLRDQYPLPRTSSAYALGLGRWECEVRFPLSAGLVPANG